MVVEPAAVDTSLWAQQHESAVNVSEQECAEEVLNSVKEMMKDVMKESFDVQVSRHSMLCDAPKSRELQVVHCGCLFWDDHLIVTEVGACLF